MENKKYVKFLILFSLILFICTGGVFAENNISNEPNTFNTNTISNNEVSTSNNEITNYTVTSTGSDNNPTDNNYLTINGAINNVKSNSSTNIKLNSGIYNSTYSNGQQISTSSGKSDISRNYNITTPSYSMIMITGAGVNSTYISGDYLYSFLNIDSTSTIYLNDLSIINFNGAIQNYGNLILVNVNFINGKDSCINNHGTLETYGNSRFLNNTAEYGSVIYNIGTVNIGENGEIDIVNNTASKNGGAIFNTENGIINIKNTLFTNCYALNGGAIYNEYGIITLNNTILTTNNATKGAGIYNFNNGKLNINNSYFRLNYANEGSAIYTAGNISISNTQFLENTEENGAIYTNSSSNIIDNSLFQSNNAKQYGGAIYNYNSNLYLNNTIFLNNIGNIGAGIYNNNGMFNITKSTFISNIATYGGCIYNKIGIGDINNSKFINNTQSTNGSGIYNLDYLKINNSDFEGNLAYNGGAIFNYKNGYLKIENSEFNNNTANNDEENNIVGKGGAIANIATTNSGLSQKNSLECEIINSTFNNNHVQNENGTGLVGDCGGAIENSYGILRIDYSKLINNSAFAGGAINNEGGITLLKSNQLINNTAFAGGAICNQANGTLFIIDSLFNGNIGDSCGGAICNGYDGYTNNRVSIVNSNFTNNQGYGSNLYTLDNPAFISGNKYNNDTKPLLVGNVQSGKLAAITIITDQTYNVNDTDKIIYIGVLDSYFNPIANQKVNVTFTRLSTNQTKTYTLITNENGVIEYPINLGSGEYSVTATSLNGSYYGTTSTGILTITDNRLKSILIANKYEKSFSDKGNFTGTLTYENGTPIIGQHISLNLTRLSDGKSKVYWVTTDINGEFQLAINLSPGLYTGYCAYAGSSQYNPSHSDLTSITVLNS
ncbi:MAG: hypothetical protein K1X33_03705 [Methanobacteriaceae archaeon]|nr:hypothetical protein [Methanobacteriaceae archaeon]